MEIDLSELKGKSYDCLDGCGLCCLCQPELDLEELNTFRRADLEKYLTGYHVKGDETEEPTAVKLQGGRGACHFLENRLCTIHDIRPRPCRQFPVQVHVMRRVQLNANLACPGIEEGGGSLLEFGESVIARIPEEELKDIGENARKIMREFDDRCLDFSIYQDPGALRKVGLSLTRQMKSQDWISRLLSWSNSEPANGIDMESPDLTQTILRSQPEPDIQEIASEGNYDQMDLDDLAQIPVYVDDGNRWTALRAREGNIEVMRMEETGSLDALKTVPLEDIVLLNWDDSALPVMLEYAELINSRDAFMGYTYQVALDQDYQFDLGVIYLGTLATSMLDLWWRTSLVGYLEDERNITETLARKGIRAYDMTSLGAPSIGMYL